MAEEWLEVAMLNLDDKTIYIYIHIHIIDPNPFQTQLTRLPPSGALRHEKVRASQKSASATIEV